MTSIRRLLSALCLAICFSSVSNAQQVDTTGNLINNNSWSGAVYGPDPGGCCASISGAGPLYDTTTDTIMFSYGQATISQSIGLEAALGAQGIVLHGYNYRWDWRLISNNTTANDNLTASIYLRDSQGLIIQSQNFSYTGAAHNIWFTESGTTSFANPYTNASSLSLSFSGRDGGFWAGYYGPELRNISLSVNYSVDPCVNDPLYSTSCAGYWDAFLAQIGTILFGAPEPEPISVAPVVEQTQIVSEPVPTASAPVASSTESSSQESSTQATTSSGKPGASLSTVLSVLSREQSRLSSLERSTVESSVDQSIKQGEKSTEEAESVAASATSESISSSQASNLSQQSSGNGLSVLSITSQSLSPLESNVGFRSIIQSTSQSFVYEEEQKTESAISFSGFSAVNVLKEETRNQETTQSEEKTETVKSNVQNNEIAGPVDIAAYTVVPAGFDAYSTALQDNAFYAPKEIYKNQNNVDNARLLRGLTGGSDRLHEQMVNQQYR